MKSIPIVLFGKHGKHWKGNEILQKRLDDSVLKFAVFVMCGLGIKLDQEEKLFDNTTFAVYTSFWHELC